MAFDLISTYSYSALIKHLFAIKPRALHRRTTGTKVFGPAPTPAPAAAHADHKA
jgi:hypothetical protein